MILSGDKYNYNGISYNISFFIHKGNFQTNQSEFFPEKHDSAKKKINQMTIFNQTKKKKKN